MADVPQIKAPTIDRLKMILADQVLTLDNQAQYVQELIEWGTAAHDEVAALKERLAALETRTNGVKAKA